MKILNAFLIVIFCSSFSYSRSEMLDDAIGFYFLSEFELMKGHEEKGLELRDSSFHLVKRLPQDDRLTFYFISYYSGKMLDGIYLGEWGNEISCNDDYYALRKKLNALLSQSMYEGDKKVFMRLKSFLDNRTGKCLTRDEM